MKKFFTGLWNIIRRSDLVLLTLCILATVYGIVLIYSSTRIFETNQYIIIQSGSLVIGIILYFIFTHLDIDILADRWRILLLFNLVLILSLVVFGVAGETGNRAWIRFGGIGVQPAEIAKIPFVILLAKQLTYLKERRTLNRFWSVMQMLLLFGVHFGLIIVISADLGSALVYFFIFVVALFASGLKLYWFGIGFGAIAAAAPILWKYFLNQNHKDRIMAPYFPEVDPTGLGITWQVNKCKTAIVHGGFTGQGLYKGTFTQGGMVSQQHTDFIFSVAGEELGFVGCMVIILLLLAIILRCFYVGFKSNSTMCMLVCTGMASMLIFQMLENIGMCLGLTPVIGLTLPFFSYGGSSIVTTFAAMGIVSGIRIRPAPSRLARF